MKPIPKPKSRKRHLLRRSEGQYWHIQREDNGILTIITNAKRLRGTGYVRMRKADYEDVSRYPVTIPCYTPDKEF